MARQMERFGPTRRGGPVFRWLGENLAVDLANTVMVVREGEVVDLLASLQDLQCWLDAEGARAGRLCSSTAHLEEIRSLRDAVRDLLEAAVLGRTPSPDVLEHVNRASFADPVALRAEARDGGLQAREQTLGQAPLPHLLGTVARSAITLVTSAEADQLKLCSAPSCGMFFIGKRRWCCSACGNRARAARHYRRVRERTASAGAP